MSSPDPQKTRLVLTLGAVVLGLATLVWWSLPRGGGAPEPSEAGSIDARGTGGEASAHVDASPPAHGRIPLLREASLELAVLTMRPESEVQKLATVDALAARLDPQVCATTCDAVRTFMGNRERFELEVVRSEDYMLPPKETLEAVAPGLTPAERATVHARQTALVLRAHGPTTSDHLPLRATLAAASVAANAISGLVYDEARRRIDSATALTQQLATKPLGEPVFTPAHVVVQMYRQDDGTMRLVTLGMQRFGSPDFSARGMTAAAAPPMAAVLNAIASAAASGASPLPILVHLDDVARVNARPVGELTRAAASSSPVAFDAVEAERTEGDPDSALLELVPPGGATREGFDAAVATLFGAPLGTVMASFDAELSAVATRARQTLPRALQRFRAGEGELFVKGPFPMADGGGEADAGVAWLWVEAARCDERTCTGKLTADPVLAGALGGVEGGATVKRAELADWLLQQVDGGTAGGESIEILTRRAGR